MHKAISFLLAVLCLCPSILFAQGTWMPKAALPPVGRSFAVAFSIGNKGYMGTGFASAGVLLNDFWEYDPAFNAWTQKANFGGGPRSGAVGFSIGNKGYVGTGESMSISYYKDFWKYDPVTNVWTQVANFSGSARVWAGGFSIGSNGYLGTGKDNTGLFRNDFWEYNPALNTWTQLGNSGATRAYIASFVLGNNAYCGTGLYGFNGPILAYNDLWKYDPITDIWTQKANLPAASRAVATSFSICNKGFLGLGADNTFTTFFKDLWMYDPATNSWGVAATFPGTGRGSAPSFVINNKAYIGTGFVVGTSFSDLWEYTCGCTGNLTLTSNGIINVACNGGSNGSVAGSVVSGGTPPYTYVWSPSGVTNANATGLSAGTYTITVTDANGCSGTQTVIITEPPDLTIDINSTSATCNNISGSANIETNGGTPSYTYLWNNGQTTSTATGLVAGNYNVIVSDANGCTRTQVIIIEPDINAGELNLPNAFSPNDDGENDGFCLQGVVENCVKDLTIIIYNRWGERVYKSTAKNFCWDGICLGRTMNTSVFAYYIEATLISGEIIIKKGNISLIR